MWTKLFSSFILAVALLTSSAPAQQETPATTAGTHSDPDASPTSSKSDLTLLTYADHKPLVVSAAELKTLSRVSVMIHNSHTNADEEYSGVRLSVLLVKLGHRWGVTFAAKRLPTTLSPPVPTVTGPYWR